MSAFRMPGLPERVTIYEVGPRDGLQNEKTIVPVADKAAFIARLAAAGLRTVEATSFVHPKWVPQLADAEELLAVMERAEGVRYPVLVPNERGLDRALRAGVTHIAVFASATESFARRNLNRTVAESLAMFAPVVTRAKENGLWVRAYVSMCFGDPWEGEVPIEQVVSVAVRLMELGCDELSLGDTIGVGTPAQVHELLDALDGVLPLPMTAVHMHDTYGMGLANTLAAIEHGVRTVDTSVGGLGGCPFAGPGARGNLATEDLVYALRGSRLTTGLDLDALVAISWWLAEELDHDPPSRVAQALGRQRRRALQAPSTLD